MKNFKNRFEFIKESLEMSESELESQTKPNWKFTKDFLVEGEDEPMLYKGTEVYYDEAGQRLVVINNGPEGMIVDLTKDELVGYAMKLASGNESFPAYRIDVLDGEYGDASKLADYISNFHDIDADTLDENAGSAYYSKEWLDKEGTSAKQFRAIVEEEAKRLGMEVHVSVKKLADDGNGNLTEVQ